MDLINPIFIKPNIVFDIEEKDFKIITKNESEKLLDRRSNLYFKTITTTIDKKDGSEENELAEYSYDEKDRCFEIKTDITTDSFDYNDKDKLIYHNNLYKCPFNLAQNIDDLFIYDNQERLSEVRINNQENIKIIYDKNGRDFDYIRSNNYIMHCEYNMNSHYIKLSFNDGYTTIHKFDNNGNKTRIKRNRKNDTYFKYDKNNNLICRIEGDYRKYYDYDDQGRIIYCNDSTGCYERYFYNKQGDIELFETNDFINKIKYFYI